MTPMLRTWSLTLSLRLALALLLLVPGALAGCVASPQPSPPNLSPSSVEYRESGADIINGHRIVGRPGAVAPPEGAVVVTNLDEERPLAAEPVRGDGSFDIVAPGRGAVFRLQARSGGARSTPLDFTVDREARALVRTERPLEDCFVVEPEYELDLGDVRVGATVERTLRVDNGCAEPLELEPTRLRETGSPFTVREDQSVVPVGGSVRITLRLAPLAPGALEATVFVEARAPMRDRRPLTLFARAIE